MLILMLKLTIKKRNIITKTLLIFDHRALSYLPNHRPSSIISVHAEKYNKDPLLNLFRKRLFIAGVEFDASREILKPKT